VEQEEENVEPAGLLINEESPDNRHFKPPNDDVTHGKEAPQGSEDDGESEYQNVVVSEASEVLIAFDR